LDQLPGVARAEDAARGATLAVALQGDVGQAAGDEGEVVEGGPGARPQDAEATDAVAAQLGLDLDVLDDGRRVGAPGRGRAGGVRVAVRRGQAPSFQCLGPRSTGCAADSTRVAGDRLPTAAR